MTTRRIFLGGLLSSLAAGVASSLAKASVVMPPQIQRPLLRAAGWIRGRYAVVLNRTVMPRFSVEAVEAARQLPDLRDIFSANCVKDLQIPAAPVQAATDRRGFWGKVFGRRAA